MELRFAVRCSVLSKRWKYLYTNIPRLKFVPSEMLPSIPDEPDRNWIIEDIISNVLLSHSGDLQGFSLNMGDSPEWIVCKIKLCKWVRYAALHNVQHLSLAQIAQDRPILPLDTFSCEDLKSLYVSIYDIDTPPDFSGFRYLTHCYFLAVNLEDPDSLLYFISKCTVLQHLYLEDCVLHRDLGKFTISAPNLQTFRLLDHGDWDIEDVDVDVVVGTLTLNCPNLLHFTLNLAFPNICVKCDIILLHEFSNRLVSAELTSNGDLIELEIFMWEEESEDYATRFVDIVGSFQTLKQLKLFSRACIQINKFPLITRLLQRLPGLEILSFTGRPGLEALALTGLPGLEALSFTKHFPTQPEGRLGLAFVTTLLKMHWVSSRAPALQKLIRIPILQDLVQFLQWQPHKWILSIVDLR